MINIIVLLIVMSLSFNCLAEEEANFNVKFKYYVSKIEENRMHFHEMLPIYDSVINLCTRQENIDAKIKYTMLKAKLTARNGEYAKAFNTYINALNTINTKSKTSYTDIINKKDCMYEMGKMAFNISMYDESISCLFDLLEYNKSAGLNTVDLNYTVRAYSLLGLIFFNIGKIQTAEDYLDQAKAIIINTDTLNNHSLLYFYNSYSGLFYFKAEYDAAVKYLSIADEYSKNINDKEIILNLYHNFAIIYQGIGEFAMSEDYFMRIFELTEGNDLSYSHALALQNLAFLYKEHGKKAAALTYYNKALDVSTRIKANKIKGSVLIEMSDLFYDDGDYKKSRDYLEKGRILKDSIFNTQNMDRIMILTNKYETRNEKIEKELLEKTLLASELGNKNKTILLTILVMIFALLVTVIFVSMYKLIFQRQANKTLSDTIVKLQQNRRVEVENSKHELETTIDDKNRELTSTALCLIKANEMLSTLKEEVRRLSNSRIESERKDIIRDISVVLNSYSPEQGWAEFKLYFEQVHQSFFSSLHEKHSDLTHGEQRICALLVLNMSAKEIATITNRSSRTVESFVYKIRIKLNIPTETKTVCYLRQFM